MWKISILPSLDDIISDCIAMVTSAGRSLYYLEVCGPDACHVHEHDSRVDARPAIVGVAGEATVPGDAWLLVLRRHGGQLASVEVS